MRHLMLYNRVCHDLPISECSGDEGRILVMTVIDTMSLISAGSDSRRGGRGGDVYLTSDGAESSSQGREEMMLMLLVRSSAGLRWE